MAPGPPANSDSVALQVFKPVLGCGEVAASSRYRYKDNGLSRTLSLDRSGAKPLAKL